MNGVKTILRKELRAYFLSPVALTFLGVFLVVTLFVFFTYARFFARNIADVRPLFEWLPILLIFLVGAITMRAWSEEQKLGTLEILMTLPLKTVHLVLGKILAGMVLVVLALGLTLLLPITVSFIGDLDWGPVIGGYLGALLLAAAYMSIGMCVSSRTDNQIVALMVTFIICGLLYLIGSEAVVDIFGNRSGELLRGIGSGSRFQSIERGVLDLRDFFYYLSIAAFFVVVNIHFLEQKRQDTVSKNSRARVRTRWLTVGLAGLNVVAVNLWMAPVTAVRADLTEEGLYSISDSTERILGDLQEPLTISGYFSEKTHPRLAPLVPRIRDFLTEYEVRGQGNVKVTFADPGKDEELEQELAELYDIKPVPFRVSARHEESLVNSYFHLLIKYGDQYETLSFRNLIEIHASESGIDVRLQNLEYDLTRLIKKVTQGFMSIEAMFAQVEDSIKLKLFFTPKKLPEDFKEVPGQIRKVASEITDKSGKKFSFEEIDVADNEALQQEIMQKYGFQPMAVDLFGQQRFYLHLLLDAGEHLEHIVLQGKPTEASVRTAIESGIKRGTPGFLRTVALFSEDPKPQQPNPQIPPQFQPPQKRPDYRLLERQLSEEFTFKRVQLTDGVVPADVDALIVAKTGSLTDKQLFGIDQFLMRGGAVIALVGAHDISVDRSGISTSKVDSSLLELLESYGVTVENAFLMDSTNARFPVPVREKRGIFTMERIKMMNYPFFPDIRREGFLEGHVALTGLQNVVLNWASPLKVKDESKKVKAEVFLSSSEESWTDSTDQVLPESFDNAEDAFKPGDELKSFPLAAALNGQFASYFTDKSSPLFEDKSGDDSAPQPQVETEKDGTGRTIKESAPDARLVVVGSSAFASDLVASLGGQMGGNVYRSNMQFVRNLVDWALADTDLLQIRTSGAFARTIDPLEENERSMLELANYGFALIALAVVVGVAVLRRRRAKSIIATEAR